MLLKKTMRMHPAAIAASAYVSAIVLGACFLLMPIATGEGGIAPVDALFTATSAVCVTGLVVVDTGSAFTLFGQAVILFLIQLGGLGVMTFSVMIFRLMGRGMSFRHRRILHDVFTPEPGGDILNLLRSIFLFTFLSELVGAALLFFVFRDGHDLGQAVWHSLFHSVSAFCNAGFSLYPDSFMAWRGDTLLNGSIMALIILGGIGFPVIHDISLKARAKTRRRLSVQTKTVLYTSGLLIVAGTVLFWLAERNGTLSGLGFRESFLASVFQSVTCRTAGFNTLDTALLSAPALAVAVALMFVGASPGSCGGGVKTTTVAVLAAFAFSRMRRWSRVNMFRRSIPESTVNRSLALTLLALLVISVAFLCLLFVSVPGGSAGHSQFLPLLFESVSAFGTVGLSMGVTPDLASAGKWLVILLMFIGRVGVITFAYVFIGQQASRGLELAEENVMIG